MPHVTGEQRNQLMMISLESCVPADAFARVIDAFVDASDLESFGFAHVTCKINYGAQHFPQASMSTN